MLILNPLTPPALKASLDRSTPVGTEALYGGFDPTDRITLCPAWAYRTGQIVGVTTEEIAYDLLTGCGKWGCPTCGLQKRARLLGRIKLGAPNKFLTLTTSPAEGESPRQVFTRTTTKIKKLFKHFRARGEISYCRILESTEKGFPHYHFAMNAPFLPQKELSEVWEKLTGARIVDIRVIRGRTAAYISKYLTKSVSVGYTRQRVSFSRGYPKEEKQTLPMEKAIYRGLDKENVLNHLKVNFGYFADLGMRVSSRYCEPLEGQSNFVANAALAVISWDKPGESPDLSSNLGW